jgi:hypothetical protein
MDEVDALIYNSMYHGGEHGKLCRISCYGEQDFRLPIQVVVYQEMNYGSLLKKLLKVGVHTFIRSTLDTYDDGFHHTHVI